jgi:hypothetical protein
MAERQRVTAVPDFMGSRRPIRLSPKINIEIFGDAQTALIVVHIYLQTSNPIQSMGMKQLIMGEHTINLAALLAKVTRPHVVTCWATSCAPL